MVIQGSDYSRTANADWAGLATALKEQGITFCGRYAVNDKAPNGRGIGAAEFAAYVAAGLDCFLYWESTEGWMLGGFAAGAVAAVNAQQNIMAAGMPTQTPVYFAADFDARPDQQAAIDDCLRGAADVLGADRVGIYGGFWVVKRCAENGSAKWFCQTSAWSGGQWFAGNHLEQYGYNHFVYGTNIDLVRAMQPHYGQASDFLITPQPQPVPEPQVEPSPEPFDGFAHGLATGTDQHIGPITYQYIDRIMTVRKGRNAPGYTKPGGKKLVTRQEGEKLRSAFIADIDGKQYLWDRTGVVYARSPFTPKLTLQRLS